MTPRNRFLAVMRGEPVDRVPLLLEGFHYPAMAMVSEAGKREILRRVHHELNFYHSTQSFVNRYLVTPLQRIRNVDQTTRNGETITTSEIDTPLGILTAVTGTNPTTRTLWTVKYPVESLADIEKIRSVPWEIPPELRPPDMSRLPVEFASRGIVHTGVSSPFVCVAGMMPYDYFLELCATELDLITELTQICLERILATLDVLLAENTIEFVWMGGCEWVTPPMASPKIYSELVQEFERPIIEKIHASGALTHVHCHGNVRSTLEMVIERGGDFFEPCEPPPDGDITFAEAKRLANGRITLGGNVEARILENADPETVEAAVRQTFSGGKNRMILQTTAGPLCEMTPRMLANYHRMIDVWEALSPILS